MLGRLLGEQINRIESWTGGASVFMRPDTPPIHFILAALVAEVEVRPAQIHRKTGLAMSSGIIGIDTSFNALAN